jgi:hypothetical protein
MPFSMLIALKTLRHRESRLGVLSESLAVITTVTCYCQPRSEASVRSERQAQRVPVSGGLRRQEHQRECALALRQVCERQDCSARLGTRWNTFCLDWADIGGRQTSRHGHKFGFLDGRDHRCKLTLRDSPFSDARVR